MRSSAGANIAMLGKASPEHKVNFCKFTNEMRNAMEDASRHSGIVFLIVGGGHQLALATEHLILVSARERWTFRRCGCLMSAAKK